MFTEVIEDKVFQAKKPCEIKYTTDSKTNLAYSPTQRIQYTAFPSVLSFTIFYKGSSYIFNCPSTEVKAKAESYLQLNLDYIISVFTTSILFSKRSQYEDGFTIETTDSCTLVNSTATKPNVLNISYPINLIVRDTTPKTLVEMKKAVPSSGIAIFDISSILKNNISHQVSIKTMLTVSPTQLYKSFILYAETQSGVDTYSQAYIYGLNTNLDDTDLSYLTKGKLLLTNNSRRFVADNSNEKIYYLRRSAAYTEKILITAYTYNKKSSETYILDMSSLAGNIIYEIPINWNSIKDLFTQINQDNIVEYTVSLEFYPNIKWTINYERKEFLHLKEFVFLNKYSVWDNILFDAKNEEYLQLEQETIKSNYKTIPISKTAIIKRIQNSGLITNAGRKEHLQDFFSSEKIYEVINSSLEEVIITSNEYLVKQLEIKELHNIQFEYSFANLKKII